MEQPSACLADLPRHLLHAIFAHLLSGTSPLAGVPLPTLISQWLALRLTCREWASVLEDVPLAADVEAASRAALSWLAARPVVLLRVGQFSGLRGRRSASAPLLGRPAERPLAERGPATGQLSAQRLVGSLAGVAASPRWTAAAFSLLQALHVRGMLSPSGEPCSFNTVSLIALPHLRHLHLERFTHFDLCGVPASLRTLKIRYQETPMFSAVTHPALDILRLPSHARLDLLELDSRASLGLLACELLAKCEAVAVRATRAFLGVCGPFGAQDVAAFHSGADLRKKAEVMAAAAAQLLLLLGGADSGAAGSTDGTTAPACPPPPPAQRLRSLELRWMCADSLVVVPLPAENVGGAGCSTGAGQAAAAAALESAQAAVHEGEDPTVEVPAERLEQLAVELGRLPCTVHAERVAGHRRAMLLRLERHD